MKVRETRCTSATVAAAVFAAIQCCCAASATSRVSDYQDGVVRGNQLSYCASPPASITDIPNGNFVRVRPNENRTSPAAGPQDYAATLNFNDSHTTASSSPQFYFMTQVFDPVWNPDGPPRSKNCGPASLAMAYRFFNKTPPGGNPSDPEQVIESARVAMTGINNNEGLTNFADVVRGAKVGGLRTLIVRNMTAINTALDRGAVVIASGCPNMPGSYGQRFGYGPGIYGHFILITAHQGDEYLVCDPLNRRGPSVVSQQEMRSFLRFWPTFALKGGIAVWNN